MKVLSRTSGFKKRVDPDGLLSPVIQRMGNSARILFELPGARDVERIKKLLQGTAQLEFWDAFKGEEFTSFYFKPTKF